MRTLAGLTVADDHGDQSLLEVIEYAPPQAMVPQDMLRVFLKDAKHRKKYRPKPTNPTPPVGRGRGRSQ